MKQLIVTIVGFFIFTSVGFSQITISKDSRIDDLIKEQSQIIPPATAPEITGYRLQLVFDSNKGTIDEARAKFASMFPKVDTYVEFKAPYYFLKAGDFRTHLDAEKIKNATGQLFPTCFVVKEKVNLPRIDQ